MKARDRDAARHCGIPQEALIPPLRDSERAALELGLEVEGSCRLPSVEGRVGKSQEPRLCMKLF